MATAPQFASVPNRGQALISTANTLRDGTGTLGVVWTAGASGGRIDEIRIKATGTTTAGMVRLFVSDGTNHRLFEEQPVAAITPSATIESAEYVLTYSNLVLEAGETLRAGTNNAESFAVHAFGGDF